MVRKMKTEEIGLYKLKLREITDWKRRDDGLPYFLVKLELEAGNFQSIWLPIHRIPQLYLLKYLQEVEKTCGDHVFLYSDKIEEKKNKVKVLKNLADLSSKYELVKELFISEKNPRFSELKIQLNELEKKLADLPESSNSSSDEEIHSLLKDVILQKEDLVTKYEPVKMDDLLEMEAEINMISNDKKPIRLSRFIRQCDINSLKHIRYVNTILIPPSLITLDVMQKRVSCSCTGEKCQLDKCSHYENAIPAYDADGRLVTNYLDRRKSIHYGHNLSCSRRTRTIHECNSGCLCGPSCPNRVIQNGSTVQKEIFSTLNGYGIGLGVRTLEDVSKGSFIGTYAGKLITNEESINLIGNKYLFDVSYSESTCSVNKDSSVQSETDSRGEYIIDASRYGNITRFMNHSCEFNVTTLYAHIEISDPKVHDIVFFAQRDIKKGEELCIHYGEQYFQEKEKCYCSRCVVRNYFNKKREQKNVEV